MDNYNKIAARIDNSSIDKYEQMLYNKLAIIKEELSEIITAAQLAKQGVVNTNLLNKEEVQNILSQIETLPYDSEIEAIEYAEPIMLQKESLLLYAISLPKTRSKEFIKSTIKNNRRIHLDTDELFLAHDGIYGIKETCSKMRDTVICNENQLQKFSSDHCINQLIRGADARCDYQFYKKPIIEPLTDNSVFLINFNGTLRHSNETKMLCGTFLVQFDNDTIAINDRNYTNEEIRTFQILSPIIQ